MRIFPNSPKIQVELEDKQEFVISINQLIFGNQSSHFKTSLFEGKINESGFNLIRKTHYFNAFRPSIIGKFNENLVTIHVGLSNFTLKLWAGMNAFFVIAFLSGKIPKIAMVLTIMNLLYYVIGWLLFVWERKLTQSSWNRIVELARN